jgi:hypothetical protein
MEKTWYDHKTKQKWADFEENKKWINMSSLGLPTYGACEFCWASEPTYKKCTNCTLDEYQVVYRKNFILDSQTLAKKMGKPHETAKVNHTQNWIRTEGVKLTESKLHLMIDSIKNNLIQDVEERKTRAKQEFFGLLDECEFIFQNRAPN